MMGVLLYTRSTPLGEKASWYRMYVFNIVLVVTEHGTAKSFEEQTIVSNLTTKNVCILASYGPLQCSIPNDVS